MSDPDLLKSGGGTLTFWADAGEAGDVLVVLDRDGVELGRGIAAAGSVAGRIRVHFEPPVSLPTRGSLYEVKNVTKEARDAKQGPEETDRGGGHEEVRQG